MCRFRLYHYSQNRTQQEERDEFDDGSPRLCSDVQSVPFVSAYLVIVENESHQSCSRITLIQFLLRKEARIKRAKIIMFLKKTCL